MKRSGNDKWPVLYHPALVKKDIPPLSKNDARRIRLAIEKKLTVDPVLYGRPLRGNLKLYWKLRVGPHRVVFSINDYKVKVLLIASRQDIYKKVARRGSSEEL